MSDLRSFFNPKSIAVIGASEKEGSVGKTMISNLLNSEFKGSVYPINPKRQTIFDKPCYPSVKDVSDDIDLAIVITPAKIVPSVIKECAEKKIKGAIIISAGFKELGESGIALEKQVLEAAQSTLRIIGPNCLGIMNPYIDLNATFSSKIAKKGNIAFISQSGALCTAALDWSFVKNVGFSAFVSVGSMLDIDWGELIQHLDQDPNTESIFIYMESMGSAHSFLKAAKKFAAKKPIIVIKAGRTEQAAQAVVSHTGSLTGSDEAMDAAFEQVGVLRIDTIDQFFDLALYLAHTSPPEGPKLAIITNAGGPGVLATDMLIQEGGELAVLDEKTKEKLDLVLPASWSHSNPIDVLGDAEALRYEKSLEIVYKYLEADAILTILTPQDMTQPYETAQALITLSKKRKKPLIASWMGGEEVQKARDILIEGGVPAFSYPDEACKVFSLLWKYKERAKFAQEPFTKPSLAQMSRDKMNAILDKAEQEKRFVLTEAESKAFLALGGIPTLQTYVTSSKEETLAASKKIAFPQVLKLHSHTITHKSAVGGVKLNLKDEQEIAKAYDEIYENVKKLKGEEHFHGVALQTMVEQKGFELILGSSFDEQLGPIILFGTGGTQVEIYRDSSIYLPPLSPCFAKRLIEQTKIYKALKGTEQAKRVDIDALVQIVVNFSHLLIEFPKIKECDINPLKALVVSTLHLKVSSEKDGKEEPPLIALDARIVLHENQKQSRQILPD